MRVGERRGSRRGSVGSGAVRAVGALAGVQTVSLREAENEGRRGSGGTGFGDGGTSGTIGGNKPGSDGGNQTGCSEAAKLVSLRTRLRSKILAAIPDAVVNGPDEERLPGNLHVSFPGVDVEALIHAMRRFSLSTGAACASGRKEASRALKAIGLDDAIAMSSLRFGLGRCNTEAHVDLLVDDLVASIGRVREISV